MKYDSPHWAARPNGLLCSAGTGDGSLLDTASDTRACTSSVVGIAVHESTTGSDEFTLAGGSEPQLASTRSRSTRRLVRATLPPQKFKFSSSMGARGFRPRF